MHFFLSDPPRPRKETKPGTYSIDARLETLLDWCNFVSRSDQNQKETPRTTKTFHERIGRETAHDTMLKPSDHRNGMNVGRWLSFFGLIAILMSLLKSSVRAIATRIAQYLGNSLTNHMKRSNNPRCYTRSCW